MRNIGKMRHQMFHQRAIETVQPNGQKKADWNDPAATLGEAWASIRGLSGKEQVFAGQMQPVANLMLTTRYVRPVYPKDRFLFGSRVFQVVNAQDIDELNWEYHIYAVEVQTGG
jgi:SPP1 family predicted phage head-tail adaptor